jgi:exosortase A
MKRDLEFPLREASANALLRSPVAWACLLSVTAILALHRETAASIVAIWIRSETFTHGFLVIPICLWLAWRDRANVATTPALPWWPGIALVALFAALWIVASAADALGVRQFALAFMLQAAVVTVIGLQLARVLAFPIAFLLFAIPFGEIFVPPMIDWTADFTVAAIRLSGVPIYREVNQFVIPTGKWAVVDACSGVRYVIASFMMGTLFAATTYRTWPRRTMFLAASILVPITANWVRAYMIVMLGHLSNNRIATGVDHIIYGWIFFGVVMLLLFWAGSFWREDAPSDGIGTATTLQPPPPVPAPSRFFFAAVACIVAAGVALPLAHAIQRFTASGAASLPAIEAANGWSQTSQTVTDWSPKFSGQAATLAQTYAKGDRRAGIYIEYYRAQTPGHELITSGNVLVAPENARWKETVRGDAEVEWDGRTRRVGRARITSGESGLEVLHAYWIDGRVTASPYVGKVLQAWSRLRGNGDDAALIVLYAPFRSRGDDARATLADFASAMTPGIERSLLAARRAVR